MEYTEARQAMVDNLLKQPQEFEKQLEILFANPHFGDVVTEVFPALLDPHNRDGRGVMKKYAEVAKFLDETKDIDDSVLVAIRVETENIEHDRRNPRQGLKAFSLRYYEGLKAEHFSVARDDEGAPLGIRIDHPSYSAASGWKDEPLLYNTEQTAIVDATLGTTRWRNQPLSEQESPTQYILAVDPKHVDSKVRAVDQSYNLMSTPLWGVVLEMRGEAIYRRAGIGPKDFPPIEGA